MSFRSVVMWVIAVCSYWLTEEPPETFHGDVHASEESIEVRVIEVTSLDKSQLK
jgi:hypothetical protein